MWKLLEKLQVDLYGPNSFNLLFSWKNIGTCFLGTKNSEKAREYFNKCIDLIDKSDNGPADIAKRDKEEKAMFYQNINLTYIDDR